MATWHELYLNETSAASVGVVLTKLPPISSAAERGSWVEIAGKDGKTWQSDYALDTQKLTMEIYVRPTANADTVLDWIQSATTMRITPFSFFWRISTVETAPQFAEWLDMPGEGFTSKISIVVQPYRYVYPEIASTTVTSGSVLTNPGTAPSAPLISVTSNGSGDIDLMIGRYSLLISAFSGTMLIDCEEMQATNAAGTTLMNSYITAGAAVTDDTGWLRRWPLLKKGANTISWTGNATVAITPRWRNR